jgi:hypothetical protein
MTIPMALVPVKPDENMTHAAAQTLDRRERLEPLSNPQELEKSHERR